MSNIEDIFFKNIIEEAKNGEVFIYNDKEGDYITFNIGFNTCIEGKLNSGNFGDSKPVLMIHSIKKLLPLLEQYVEEIEKHAEWVEEWRNNYDISANNIKAILKEEIAKVFVQVLECAGVFKRTEEGKKAFKNFVLSL